MPGSGRLPAGSYTLPVMVVVALGFPVFCAHVCTMKPPPMPPLPTLPPTPGGGPLPMGHATPAAASRRSGAAPSTGIGVDGGVDNVESLIVDAPFEEGGRAEACRSPVAAPGLAGLDPQ